MKSIMATALYNLKTSNYNHKCFIIKSFSISLKFKKMVFKGTPKSFGEFFQSIE